MKLLIAIVDDMDAEKVSRALVQKNFGVTQIASTGGFLRRGSSTLLIGVLDEKVHEALETIRNSVSIQTGDSTRKVTLFVVAVKDFQQI